MQQRLDYLVALLRNSQCTAALVCLSFRALIDQIGLSIDLFSVVYLLVKACVVFDEWVGKYRILK